MSSAITVTNWTADGTDMVDPDGICFHRLVRGGPGETAATRGDPDTIPAKVGLAPRLWEVERRSIEFEGWVRGSGSIEADQIDDYWANRLTCAAVLDPTQFVTIVLTLRSGGQFSITARPVGQQPGYNQMLPSIALANVEFESFDPDWVALGS